MVGLRVLDVGLLVLWLVWFYRVREDDGEQPEEGGGGDGGSPRPKAPRSGPGGGGLTLPLGPWAAGTGMRDGHRPTRTPNRRRSSPSLPHPLPARVRSPHSPDRVTRRG